jgi:hypothetical protein
MAIPKPKAPARVWRISADEPLGEWVQSVPAPAPAAVPSNPKALRPSQGDSDGHWLMSSFDLLSGSEVTEDDETIPGELLDELFAPKKFPPKNPG